MIGRYDKESTARIASWDQEVEDLVSVLWPADSYKKRSDLKRASAQAAENLTVNQDHHCHRPLAGMVITHPGGGPTPDAEDPNVVGADFYKLNAAQLLAYKGICINIKFIRN